METMVYNCKINRSGDLLHCNYSAARYRNVNDMRIWLAYDKDGISDRGNTQWTDYTLSTFCICRPQIYRGVQLDCEKIKSLLLLRTVPDFVYGLRPSNCASVGGRDKQIWRVL